MELRLQRHGKLSELCFPPPQRLLLLPIGHHMDITSRAPHRQGSGKCQNKRFRFRNFIRIFLVARIIEFDSFTSGFAQVAYLSYSPIRVSSETLALRRAFPNGPIAEHIPPS